MTQTCPYAVLGLSPHCAQDDIRPAFVTAAKAAHPDVGTGSTVRMAEVNAAYEKLKNAASRAAHDVQVRVDSAPDRKAEQEKAAWEQAFALDAERYAAYPKKPDAQYDLADAWNIDRQKIRTDWQDYYASETPKLGKGLAVVFAAATTAVSVYMAPNIMTAGVVGVLAVAFTRAGLRLADIGEFSVSMAAGQAAKAGLAAFGKKIAGLEQKRIVSHTQSLAGLAARGIVVASLLATGGSLSHHAVQNGLQRLTPAPQTAKETPARHFRMSGL